MVKGSSSKVIKPLRSPTLLPDDMITEISDSASFEKMKKDDSYCQLATLGIKLTTRMESLCFCVRYCERLEEVSIG